MKKEQHVRFEQLLGMVIGLMGIISLYGILSGKSEFSWFYLVLGILMVTGGFINFYQFIKK